MKKTVSNSCFHNQRGKPSIAFSKKQSFTWQTCPRQLGRVHVRVKEEEHVRVADKKWEGWSKSLMASCRNSAGARSSEDDTRACNLTWRIQFTFFHTNWVQSRGHPCSFTCGTTDWSAPHNALSKSAVTNCTWSHSPGRRWMISLKIWYRNNNALKVGFK